MKRSEALDIIFGVLSKHFTEDETNVSFFSYVAEDILEAVEKKIGMLPPKDVILLRSKWDNE